MRLFNLRYNHYTMSQCKKQRTVKDLYFLCSLPKEEIAPNLVKRLEKAGLGQTFGETKIPIDAYISYDKYDYQGRIVDSVSHMKVKSACAAYSQALPPGVHTAIKTMKVNQLAWFNARTYDLHLTESLRGQGCHFCITVESFKHKNDDNFGSKKLVFDNNKKEGKELFESKQYYQAMKKYKNIINITDGFDKKKMNENQIKELKVMNLNGKQNFLKCFSKVKKHDEEVIEEANKYLKQLIQVNGMTDQNLYLKANVQMHMRYLTDALETAHLFYSMRKEEGLKLINKIKDRIKNKARYAPIN